MYINTFIKRPGYHKYWKPSTSVAMDTKGSVKPKPVSKTQRNKPSCARPHRSMGVNSPTPVTKSKTTEVGSNHSERYDDTASEEKARYDTDVNHMYHMYHIMIQIQFHLVQLL